MIDWYTIEYLYNESFNRFTNIMFPNMGVMCTSSLKNYDMKKLYRFFDKEGIYLNVELYGKYHWVYNISLHNGTTLGSPQITRHSREEIEVDGFIECFKLLDKKIREYGHVI